MADTIPGDPSTFATLGVDASVTSSIDFFGDSDWWRASLSSGYAYMVDLQGWDTGGGSLLDPWLWIYDALGYAITYDDDSGYGLDSAIYFVPAATGSYFLAAEQAGNYAIGSYTLSLRSDLLASSATAAGIAVGSGGVSAIDFFGDSDWVAISLVAGQTYLLDLKGSASASGTLVDPLLGIADSSGQILWWDDDSGVGLDSRIVFTAAASGTYYLTVQEANHAGTGSYALTTANMNAVALQMTLGVPATGNLQSPSEMDVFRVTAAAGSLLTLSFDVPSGVAGSPFELQVVDGTGQQITAWTTGTDFSFTVGSPAGGAIYVIVGPGSVYSSGQYGLAATSEALDFGSTPTSAIKPLTGDAVVDAATHGYYWSLNAPRVVTWAIADSASAYWIDPIGAMAALQGMLGNFEAVANIHLEGLGYYSSVEAANAQGADIVVSLDGANAFFSSSNQWARAFFPSTGAAFNPYPGAAGDVWININSAANALSYEPGSAGYFLALHEFGHALGLKHPHDDGGTGHPTYAQAGIGPLNVDWATVMSYADDLDWNLRQWDPSTLMPLDVIGMQSIYGANSFTNLGDSSYSLTADDRYQTIWDAGGTDGVSAAGASEGWQVYLPYIQLAASNSALTGFALSSSEAQLPSPHTLYWMMGDIENATGSAHGDGIYGNASANALRGGAGDDSIAGGLGNDTLRGGAGNDSLAGGLNRDTLFGGIGNDMLGGGKGFDSMDGGEGNDTLAGGLGVDTLTGGTGADHFIFRTALNAATNIDTITDFESGLDVIELSASIFTAYAGVIGTTVSTSANLLYVSGTGALSYDFDGAGGNAALTFAILGVGVHPATLGSDFLIVA